ncbi:MAG: hypothetical protein GXC78_14690 [Chitinophagaceae bacterium]|nr:hypothetical protein [Chitinophagaceae bacterium]
MTYSNFINSLQQHTVLPGLSLHLQSLWHDAKGHWEEAHALIQDEEDHFSARIHAYLHRKEGDRFNADYWYQRAGTRRPDISLEEEWEVLVKTLLPE